ncbi:hypothetical protein B1691_12980 [Geobacillus sp. 47C-IIb]|nr:MULTISPECIES: hypothetical protein [Geobacillus]OQP08943.1 hypothetical protein B1691_12980 [Geobacillus sp. 47C-IIb]PJW19297.1 hypothetical protein CV632_16970 [Geobacillus thermodenitrificans]QNU32924.1 hypothetical protein IC804_06435 [Geobacillus sp. 47C-IIb]
MAQTPYHDLASQDILSAHISGLQHDINKMQAVLEMKTAQATGHVLTPVADQDDPTIRYRIYEGTIRNWLDNPTPVIYRNGVQVNPNEYEISPAHGVVVFHDQQNSNDTISADFTYITNTSAWRQSIDGSIGSIPTLQQTVNRHAQLFANNPSGVEPFYPVSGTYVSHFRRDYNPINSDGSANVNSHVPAFRILVYGNTIDAFPFPVTTKTRFSKAAMKLNSASTDVPLRIGIYRDSGLRPSELLFQSPVITIPAAGGWGMVDIDWELDPGFYWIARHDGATAYYDGLNQVSAIPIVKFNAQTFLQDLAERPNPHNFYGGYRATDISFGDMPSTFPESGALFQRASYCSPWLVVA